MMWPLDFVPFVAVAVDVVAVEFASELVVVDEEYLKLFEHLFSMLFLNYLFVLLVHVFD